MHLSEIRRVTLYYVQGHPSSYLIPAAEVDRFVEASKRLHWRPGRNPHNNEEAAKVWRITVAELELKGPFWWTTPDLQSNGDPAGARIIDGYQERQVFVDAELVNRWEAERAEDEARHYRELERAARESADADL